MPVRSRTEGAAHALGRAAARHPGAFGPAIHAECSFVSPIGRPIDESQIIDLRLRPARGLSLVGLRLRIEAIAPANFQRLDRFADSLPEGRLGRVPHPAHSWAEFGKPAWQPINEVPAALNSKYIQY